MKTLFSIAFNRSVADIWLLLLRVSVGASMLTHGIPKLKLLFTVQDIQFPDPLHVGPVLSLSLAVMAEALCSAALILGLGTRLIVLPLLFTMGMAILVIHASDPFAARELALLYFLVFTVFLVMGPGKYSLDNYVSAFFK